MSGMHGFVERFIQRWRDWHRAPRWRRWLLKTAILLTVVCVTLFPRVRLLPTWITRLSDMNRVVEVNRPELAALAADARGRADAETPAALLHATQEVVCERIPYAWDWDTWGVVDYLPTTGEVLALGREDCDGRAVLAASVLRHMGIEAVLVSDLKHTWVWTPVGETMSPGQGARTLESGAEGTRLRLGSLAENLARGLAFGIAVFPLTRELVIVVALAAVTAHPALPRWRGWTGFLLLLFGLALIRDAGPAAVGMSAAPETLWAGVGMALAGWVTLAVRGASRQSRAAPAE